jgi:hypothetical protein
MLSSSRRSIFAALLVAGLLPQHAQAWGDQGHRIIALNRRALPRSHDAHPAGCNARRRYGQPHPTRSANQCILISACPPTHKTTFENLPRIERRRKVKIFVPGAGPSGTLSSRRSAVRMSENHPLRLISARYRMDRSRPTAVLPANRLVPGVSPHRSLPRTGWGLRA